MRPTGLLVQAPSVAATANPQDKEMTGGEIIGADNKEPDTRVKRTAWGHDTLVHPDRAIHCAHEWQPAPHFAVSASA